MPWILQKLQQFFFRAQSGEFLASLEFEKRVHVGEGTGCSHRKSESGWNKRLDVSTVFQSTLEIFWQRLNLAINHRCL
jgi:hypothetical protein